MAQKPPFSGLVMPSLRFALCLIAWSASLSGCKTRVFGDGKLRSAGESDPSFIHWVPGQSPNKTWEQEKAARTKEWDKLHSPLKAGAKPGGTLEAIRNQAVNCFGLTCNTDYRDAVWGFNWFRDTPVGFTGIPLVIFRAMMEDAKQTDSPFFGIWGELSWYGLTPHPRNFDQNGVYHGNTNRRPLPLGMGWTRPPDEDPKSFGNPLAMAKEAVQSFAQSKIQRSFISCGSCHIGRVAIPEGNSHRIQFLYGAPSTEYDQTAFGEAAARALQVIAENDQGMIEERLIRAIEALEKRERHFPYGTDLDEVYWNGVWQRNVPSIWRQLELGVVKAKMRDIFAAMTTKLATREAVVSGLRQVAYSGPGKPVFDGDSPGSLDAFGFGASIVAITQKLKAAKPGTVQEFNSKEQQALKLNDRLTEYYDALVKNPSGESVIPKHAAKVDPASIWGERPGLRNHANWDGNQRSAGARALSTSLAITANPDYVDVDGSSYVKDYMAYNPGGDKLPTYPSASAIYPFPINEALAAEGQKLFEQNCYKCHHPENQRVYPIDPSLVPDDRLAQINERFKPDEGWLGTDPYRAIQITTPVRAGLLALWNETCNGRTWCSSQDEKNQDLSGETREALRWDTDVFRSRGDEYKGEPQLTGYVASPLDGIWARAPFLHNGSVPTIRALLIPSLRNTSVQCGSETKSGFWRGNILYDEKDLGFEHRVSPFKSCNPNWKSSRSPSPFEGAEPLYVTAAKSARIYDYTLEGNSNKGHDTPGFLGPVDWANETLTLGGQELKKIDALIEYLKTL